MKNSRGKEIKVESDLSPPAPMPTQMTKPKPQPESCSSGMKRQIDMPLPPALPAAPRHPVQRRPWMAMTTVPPPPAPTPKPKSERVEACSSGMKLQIDSPPPTALPAPRQPVQRRPWMAMAVPPPPPSMPKPESERVGACSSGMKRQIDRTPAPALPAAPRHPVQRRPWMAMAVPPPPPSMPKPESERVGACSSGMKRQIDRTPAPALPAAPRRPVQRPAAPRHPVQRRPWMAMTVPPPPALKPKSERVEACSSGMKRQIDSPPSTALPAAPRRPVQRRPWMAMAVPPPPPPMPVTVFYRGSISSFNLPPEKAELLMMFCKTADCKVPEPVPEPSDFIQPSNENPIGLNGLNQAVKAAGVSRVELARRNSIIRFIEQRNARRCKDGDVPRSKGQQVAGQKNDEVGTSQVKKPKNDDGAY